MTPLQQDPVGRPVSEAKATYRWACLAHRLAEVLGAPWQVYTFDPDVVLTGSESASIPPDIALRICLLAGEKQEQLALKRLQATSAAVTAAREHANATRAAYFAALNRLPADVDADVEADTLQASDAAAEAWSAANKAVKEVDQRLAVASRKVFDLLYKTHAQRLRRKLARKRKRVLRG